MIKQSLQKIDKIIRERQHSLPEVMLKLEAFLLHFSKKVLSQGEEHIASDLYSQAVRFFRNYFVQQPYKLAKLTAPLLAQAIQNNSLSHLEELLALRNRFLKQLSGFTPTDPFGKRIISELTDFKWAKRLAKELQAAQQLRRISQLKKGETSFYNELAVLMWYGEFKGQYLVHVTDFLEKCVPFFREHLIVAQFIDSNSFPYLQQLCDPQKKYYLTVHQCDNFFHKLRSPEVLRKLWQLTQQKRKVLSFQSESSVVIHLKNKQQSVDRVIGVTGQKLILAEGVQQDVKSPPVVIVGSAMESDLVLKSKYISRKQMLIVEERKSPKEQQQQKYNYHIVCLSLTNFTLLQYPYRIKAGVGLIFYAEDVKYQIIACEREETTGEIQEEQDERTLSLLPSQNSSTLPVNDQKITLLILSGQDKQQQFTLKSSTFKQLKEVGNKHEVILKDYLQYQRGYFIRLNVKILAKTSKDILEARTSRKIRLTRGMKIILDEYELAID